MKSWMNGAKFARESEGKRLSGRMSDNFERTQEAFGELAGRPGRPDIFSRHKYLFSHLKVRKSNPEFIGVGFIALLGDFGLEHLVEFVEIYRHVTSPERGEFAFGVNGEVWIVALVGKERRDSGGSVRSIVVSEFGKRKEGFPIVLLIGAINADVLLEGLIGTFRLSVGFGMVTGGEMEFHIDGLSEGLEELGDKLGATV